MTYNVFGGTLNLAQSINPNFPSMLLTSPPIGGSLETSR